MQRWCTPSQRGRVYSYFVTYNGSSVSTGNVVYSRAPRPILIAVRDFRIFTANKVGISASILQHAYARVVLARVGP